MSQSESAPKNGPPSNYHRRGGSPTTSTLTVTSNTGSTSYPSSGTNSASVTSGSNFRATPPRILLPQIRGKRIGEQRDDSTRENSVSLFPGHRFQLLPGADPKISATFFLRPRGSNELGWRCLPRLIVLFLFLWKITEPCPSENGDNCEDERASEDDSESFTACPKCRRSELIQQFHYLTVPNQYPKRRHSWIGGSRLAWTYSLPIKWTCVNRCWTGVENKE